MHSLSHLLVFFIKLNLFLEAQHLGLSEFVLGVDTVGVVSSMMDDGVGPRQVISWAHSYSAWDLFSLLTSSIFFCPGIGTGEGGCVSWQCGGCINTRLETRWKVCAYSFAVSVIFVDSGWPHAC